MKFINEFVLSVFAYKKAVKVIPKYGLYKYVGLLTMLLLFFVIPVMIIGETSAFISSFIPFLDGQKYAQMGSSFLSGISGFFLLLFLIPIFSLVSATVNDKLQGTNSGFSIKQLVLDIVRGLKITIRNLAYQYITLLLLLLILNLFSTFWIIAISGKFLVFLVTSYFYGFSLMDYAMENHQMDYTSSVTFVRSHMGIALGLGVLYFGIISINNLAVFKDLFGSLGIYWSTFAEAIVAFIGVIAANLILDIVIRKQF